ncbi:hypothetical protein HRI_000241800 [Hibiscus trionum]|uniref:Uncharacterized protein n=1 Tax=Hibiscus trionum TaxID=183268 RepID=A0A9W7GXJ4_HIBTR|nr:hypothetical protein HRI_000241800 [Hibiscus trionum]
MTNSENRVTGIGFNRNEAYISDEEFQTVFGIGEKKKHSINCQSGIKTWRRREPIYSKTTAAVITLLIYALAYQLATRLHRFHLHMMPGLLCLGSLISLRIGRLAFLRFFGNLSLIFFGVNSMY